MVRLSVKFAASLSARDFSVLLYVPSIEGRFAVMVELTSPHWDTSLTVKDLLIGLESTRERI